MRLFPCLIHLLVCPVSLLSLYPDLLHPAIEVFVSVVNYFYPHPLLLYHLSIVLFLAIAHSSRLSVVSLLAYLVCLSFYSYSLVSFLIPPFYRSVAYYQLLLHDFTCCGLYQLLPSFYDARFCTTFSMPYFVVPMFYNRSVKFLSIFGHLLLEGGRLRSLPGGGGCTQFVHGRSRMTIDPRIPTMPGRSMSGFHQPGRHWLHQARSAVRCSASRMKVNCILPRTARKTDFGTLCLPSCLGRQGQ